MLYFKLVTISLWTFLNLTTSFISIRSQTQTQLVVGGGGVRAGSLEEGTPGLLYFTILLGYLTIWLADLPHNWFHTISLVDLHSTLPTGHFPSSMFSDLLQTGLLIICFFTSYLICCSSALYVRFGLALFILEVLDSVMSYTLWHLCI
jgi:hypothetical protein